MNYTLLLIFTFLVLLYLTRRNSKDVNPLFIFYFTWAISFILYVISYYNYDIYNLYKLLEIDTISNSTILFIINANLLIYLGYFIVNFLMINKKNENHSQYNFPINFFYYFTIKIAFLFFVADIILNTKNYFSIGSLYEIRNEIDFEGSVFASVAIYLSLIALPVSIWQITKKNKNYLNWIPLLIITISSIVDLSKYLLIFTFVYWLSFLMLIKNDNYINKLNFKYILLRALIILSTISIIITALRLNQSVNKSDNIGAFPIIFTYTSGYIASFSNYFEEYNSNSTHSNVSTNPTDINYNNTKNRFGNQTFSGLYRILNQLGIVKYPSSVHYEGMFNVYTFYRDLISDFGINGTYFICFFIGAITTFINKILNRGNPVHIIYITLITTILVFTITYSLFGFTFIFFMFLSPKLFLKKQLNYD